MTCLKLFCLLLAFVSHSFAREAANLQQQSPTARHHISLTPKPSKKRFNRGEEENFLDIFNGDVSKQGNLSQSAKQSHLDRNIIAGCSAVGAFGGYIAYHSLFGDVSSSISQSYTSMAWHTATDPGTLGGALVGAFIGGVIVREKSIAQQKLVPSAWGFLGALGEYTSKTISYAIQTPTDWTCDLLDRCARQLRQVTYDHNM